MAANEFSEFQQKKSLGRVSAPKKETSRSTGGKGSSKEKPAFGSIGIPGKTQGKDRSGGVRRLKTHPRTVGI